MPSEDDVPPCCPVEDCTQEDGHERVRTCGRVNSSHRLHLIHSSDACDSCGYCEERCRDNGECTDCNSCESHISTDDWCGECECCHDCCACVSCCRCGRRFPDSDAVCSDCNRCGSNCGCICDEEEPSPNAGVFVRGPDNPEFWAATKKGFVTNPVRRMVACEIEVADCSPDVYGRLKAVAHNWGASIVSDGSLPGDTGFEINTAPANGNQFEAQLREWTTALHEGRAKVNEQCGLHVHVDARDILKDDLMKVIALYCRVETDLFGLVAPSRKTNGTCLPCAEDYMSLVGMYETPYRHRPTSASLALNWRQMLFSRLYGIVASRTALKDTLCSVRRQRRPGARYRALNLHSYFYRKTFEFRLHHGTTQYAKIRNWSLLCASFVDRAVASNWTQIQQWPNGIAGLLKLAPDLQSKQWVKERWAVFNPEKQIDDDGRRLEYAEV